MNMTAKTQPYTPRDLEAIADEVEACAHDLDVLRHARDVREPQAQHTSKVRTAGKKAGEVLAQVTFQTLLTATLDVTRDVILATGVIAGFLEHLAVLGAIPALLLLALFIRFLLERLGAGEE